MAAPIDLKAPLAGQICLLTHPTEYFHPTNTAVLALKIAQRQQLPLRRLQWHRLHSELSSSLFDPSLWCLLYPTAQATVMNASLHEATRQPLPRPNMVILDATWQRAQKMYNQSNYLQQLPTVSLATSHTSKFARRRNQKTGAWCTAEVIQWLWQQQGCDSAAVQLADAFETFNGGHLSHDEWI